MYLITLMREFCFSYLVQQQLPEYMVSLEVLQLQTLQLARIRYQVPREWFWILPVHCTSLISTIIASCTMHQTPLSPLDSMGLVLLVPCPVYSVVRLVSQ